MTTSRMRNPSGVTCGRRQPDGVVGAASIRDMPLAQRKPNAVARRRWLIPLLLVGVLFSLALVHCPKGIAALTHTAASSSSADIVGADACATADAILVDNAAHTVRPSLAMPTVVIAFNGLAAHSVITFSRGSPGNVNPLAALDGRSLLYRIGVIRR